MESACNTSLYIHLGNHTPCLQHQHQQNYSHVTSSVHIPQNLEIPREMLFNDDSLFSVVAYSVLFVFAAIGNLTVFITLFRNRHRKSRVNLFIMNLSVADLIVTFVMMPLEIGWHATVGWIAGDGMCRVMMFWRAIGFYLSSFILITISLDRYFAINHPLSLSDADKRAKIMLSLAWCFSAIASVPQSVIFHVESHPAFPWFQQCVTFNFYPSPAHELAYNLFNLIALYAAPLLVILVSYSLILWEIHKKTRESKEQSQQPLKYQHDEKTGKQRAGRETIRRSGMGRIEKARIRTLKMTVVIVLVFVTCWTPYFVISAWWWIDKSSATLINPKLQRGMFLFAVSNSCVNPIVYGMFTNTFLREFKRLRGWLCNPNQQPKRSKDQPLSSSHNKLHLRLLHHHNHHPNSALSSSCSLKTALRHNQTRANQNGALSRGAYNSAPAQCPVQELMCTTCAVAISSDSDNPVFHMRVHRQLTPPHIAEGRGHTQADFDRYILL